MRAALAKGTAWSTAVYITGSLVGVLVVPILLQSLGPDRFGLYALSQAVVGYAGVLNMGVGRGVARMVADRRAGGAPAAAESIVSTSLLLLGGFSGLLVAVCVPAAEFAIRIMNVPAALHAEGVLLLRAVVAAYALSTLAGPFHGALTGVHKIDASKRIELVSLLSGSAMSVGAVLAGFGLSGVAMATIISAAAGLAMVTWRVMRLKEMTLAHLRFDRDDALALWRYGWRSQVMWLAGMVNRSVDKVYLGAFGTLTGVSAYEVGDRASFSLVYLANSLAGPLLPVMTEHLSSGNLVRARRAYRSATMAFTTMAVALAAVAVALSERILAAWLGEVPSSAPSILAILAIGYGLSVSASASSVTARSLETPSMATRAAALYAVVNVVLSLLGVLVWGAIGAATGSAISAIGFSVWFSWRVERRILGCRRPVFLPIVARALTVCIPVAATIGYLVAEFSQGLGRLVLIAVVGAAALSIVSIALAVMLYAPIFPAEVRIAARATIDRSLRGIRSACSR